MLLITGVVLMLHSYTQKAISAALITNICGNFALYHQTKPATVKYFRICILFFALLAGRDAYSQSTIPAEMLCAQTLVSGDVALTWGPSTEACGAFTEYQVYASTVFAGPYALLTTIPAIGTTNYTHVGANGTVTTWYYYVVAVYACAGYTMTTSDTLDNQDPIAPQLDYVTVTGGLSEIHWLPSPSPETNSYIIYRDIGGFTPVATVYGRFTTTFTDPTGTPNTGVETYTIAARDSCNNLGPFNNDSHHTIFLSAQQINCSDQLQLTWNAYDTWTAGVFEYQVWADRNFTGLTFIDNVPAGSPSYVLTGLNDGDHICITVRALRADGTATSISNEVCLDVNIVVPAAYNVMRNATVTGPTQIALEWYPDNAADLEKISVQRSTDNIDYVNLITGAITIPVPVIDNYNDNSIATNSIPFYYRTITTDSCGVETSSGYVKTIILKGNDNANFTNNISWSDFEITNGTNIEYRVYRDDGAGFNLIATVTPGTLAYLDDVSAFVNIVDHFCYQVECLYQLNAPENGVNEQLTSMSNILCLDQGPRIYVPNAIVVGGVNAIFKPVIIYGSADGYLMQIFNRYGQAIFETTDINAGWDGTYEGETVPLGAYGYLITFTATNGQVITKKGNVTVLK